MLLPLKAIISRHTRKDGKTLIYYQYCFSATNRILLSTELAIPPSFWNAKRQCISKLIPTEFGDCETLNKELDWQRKIIETIIEHGISTREQNVHEYVKALYKPDFKVESLQRSAFVTPLKKREPDFFTELDLFIKSKEKKVDKQGMGNFRSLKERLQAFEEFKKEKIMFASLDYNFYALIMDLRLQ